MQGEIGENVTYCNAEAGGITGESFILAAHIIYVLAAAWWVQPARRAGATLVSVAAVVYAADSFFWHATRWPGFLAADGALTVFFLTLGYFHAMRSTKPTLRAVLHAAAYLPLYSISGEPIYDAAMLACGFLYLRLLFQPAYCKARGWFLAALTSILLALTGLRTDAVWCGTLGFVTGHGLCHFFDGLCFFFLMGGLFRAQP